jgi:KaiC/GvpD/RAD55 family RecA-like ATPase
MATEGMPHDTETKQLDEWLASRQGTNLLVTGPPLAGKGQLAVDQLDGDDDALLVTTTRGAPKQLEGTSIDRASLSVVDCTPGETAGPGVTNVGSPADLTGISMPVSEFLQDTDEPVLALDSISSLLMYVDEAPVFRLLSVLTSHVRQSDGVGLYTLDDGCHEDEVVATLAQLFDGEISLFADGEATIDGIEDAPNETLRV